ncbi:slowpoke-binding protein-like isoform X4 [Centruroides sculpturatus]|nr:slowpoke-binding protein-like isoform X4 [Centruroides sculpturatus]XP_023234406.1 slowpoke-binding protein-like isoform X4 [Centruroides sculpturatus]XP_023234407.1 slowpoke-binding protein-like isoform X4 [Centruroides sculpturatus]XP_023234408.1 slowpoke-binding protein-like isoform X4 [Centruroides sculpturatus]XP_023234409.1 slowpoke-binding protein-like isoform X4 [Centruroides sculpturatus]
MDRKLQRDADRNLALINCQHYLQNSLRYVFIQQLNDLGSRVDKHWFLVRDTATKTDRLLIMMPVSDNCPILCNTTTRQALLELFVAFQHPYIYPILDVDFTFLNQQQFVVFIMPFNDKGSLKDLIYQSNCQHDWREKYQYYGTGLSESQIQQLGRQILEGMIFMREHGFPTFGHLHCGNVIIQNGVARISGLENVLLGNTTRIYFLLQKYICDNQDCVDSICFGHLLFEMAAGYELNTPYPKEKNYRDLNHCPRIIKVLKFIFRQEGIHYPLIQEVSSSFITFIYKRHVIPKCIASTLILY